MVENARRVRTPVDTFVLAKLDAHGLGFSPEADRQTLLRRATFDLTGLPPTPEEVDRFLADTAAGSYVRVIDRLLASPAYGERWGRHWLDNAGYADTHGGDNDLAIIKENKNIWKYRDYVVRSLNADKPFDRFLTEQLAGDELVDWRHRAPRFTPATLDALVATGFLRNAPDDTNEQELNRPLERNEIVARVTESVANNVLGLTFHCARCHNHKYDPVTQRDYYRLIACFTPVYDPGHWKLPERAHSARRSWAVRHARSPPIMVRSTRSSNRSRSKLPSCVKRREGEHRRVGSPLCPRCCGPTCGRSCRTWRQAHAGPRISGRQAWSAGQGHSG